MAFVEQVDVEGFPGPELQHILTNTSSFQTYLQLQVF